MDQTKRLQTAEQLLKQGKTDAALSQLRRLADEAPGDLLTLNRVGDLLARQKRTSEAIGYYRRIAEKFMAGGYLAKAVAIHKKILRLDSATTESLVDLGQLYLRQRLPHEARGYFERAAQIYHQGSDWARARAVYEELLTADPEDSVNRAHLAEVMAAEGDHEGAGNQLLRLGDSLLDGQPEDAEAAYRRSGELLPGRADSPLGIARSLFGQGREDEALAFLEESLAAAPDARLRGELILRCEMTGRADRSAELLEQSSPDDFSDETVEHLFRYRLDAGGIEPLWERLDRSFEIWSKSFPAERLDGLLERLASIEEAGHLPALERLLERLEECADVTAIAPVLEKIVAACRHLGLGERAESASQRLEELLPRRPAESPAAAPSAAHDEAEAPAMAPVGDGLPESIELPAVPLKPSDKEFVSGRLTQADILENYGLADQAIQQVREAIEKFPGDVPACKKLVHLLTPSDNPRALRDAFVTLAVALRASGSDDGARDAARRAGEQKMPLDARSRTVLESLGLPATPPPAPKAAITPSPPKGPAAEPPPAPAARAVSGRPPAPPDDDTDDDIIVIDFDAMDDATPVAEPNAASEPAAPEQPAEAQEILATPEPPPDAVAEPGVRIPSSDMLEEISLYVERRRFEDALRRVEALRDLGYAGDDLAEFERILREEVASTKDEGADEDSLDFGDAQEFLATPDDAAGGTDDDLTAIAAALEAELLEDESEPLQPDAGTEQGIQEVFTAFRERVEQEVDSDDYRTHYDLGLGYKEMGLLNEAIDEFEISCRSDELRRESRVMIAICRKELGETEAAIEAYRQALDASAEDVTALVALRYDLGEILAQVGEHDAALSEFREVLDADPGFRDVRHRVDQLEAGQTH